MARSACFIDPYPLCTALFGHDNVLLVPPGYTQPAAVVYLCCALCYQYLLECDIALVYFEKNDTFQVERGYEYIGYKNPSHRYGDQNTLVVIRDESYFIYSSLDWNCKPDNRSMLVFFNIPV